MIRTKSVLTFKARLRSRCSWETLAKFGIGIASSIAITSLASSTLALVVEEVPNPKRINGGWVSDQANILSPTTEADINQIISKIAAKNGTEMAVVTVLSTAPSATPKEFASALFNYWGIGKKGEDNGVLLLISKSERRVEVETGYGVEDILPDSFVGNIISQKMTPEFKKGNFDQGTLAGTKALVQTLETKSNSDSESAKNLSSDAPNPGLFYLYLILGLGAGVLIIVLVNYIRMKIKDPNVLSDSESDRLLGQKGLVRSKMCPSCNQPMSKVNSAMLTSYLSRQRKVAQKLGSVEYQGWHCASCHPKLTSLENVYLRTYPLLSSRFKKCPNCQELTVTHKSLTVEAATQYKCGKRLIIDSCHCCDYQKETEETIDRILPPPPPPLPTSSSNWWSGNESGSDWGSSGGSDWGGGSSSGGSSDWGGGSSGGGGAGGSW